MFNENDIIKKELLNSEERYRNIFNSASRLILLVYKNNIIKDCNDRIIDILGYKKEEVIGKDVEIFFAEESISSLRDKMKIIFSTGEAADREFIMIKKDGTLVDVTTRSSITIDEEGRSHTICFIADITKQKESEKQLRRAAEELKKSNEELEEFAYVASHDLQEPLRVISSYCQLIKEKSYPGIDEDGKKYLDYTIASAMRMKTLVKELLDFSRVGRKNEQFEKINLQELLQEVLCDFEVALEETGAEIIIESDMPHVMAISFRMKQLFHNIISNSLKFKSDKKPIIRIGCCEDVVNSNYWLFYIKDNGIGIQSEYYDRIFGVFKRLYSREEYPGTGIGLALCKKIVEAHGGKIWVESDIKEGTYIYFTISKAWAIFDD